MGTLKVTMNGIVRAYENSYRVSIFNDIILPYSIDKDALISEIELRCGEFGVIHTDMPYFKYEIDTFFKVHYPTFQRWADTLNAEYNPIENYDRYEEYEDNSVASGKTSANSKGSVTESVSAYDTSGFSNANKSDDSSEGSTTSDATNKTNHTAHLHGNIGVTTNAQMASEEMQLRKKYNIYRMIADLFCEEFTIMVY